MTEPSTVPPPPGQPDRRALVEAYEDVIRSAEQRRMLEAMPEPPPSRSGFWVTMGLLLAISGGLLLVRPHWLFPRPPKEAQVIKEASLRLLMYQHILRLERYRKANGHLAPTLADAGSDSIAVQYLPESASDRYTLVGESEGQRIIYTSDVPPMDFLGNSYQVIQGRPHR